MTSFFDLHVHTNRGSPDSGLNAQELVTEAHRIGLTGAMVTEHNGWPRHDFEEFARNQSVILIRALEVYTPLGHIITMGLDRHVTGFHGDVNQVRELKREVERVGGFMILAHPFRFLFDVHGIYTQNKLFEDPAKVPDTPEEAALHPVFELVDDIEVVNGGNIEVENRFAQEVAAVLGRWGTGGSDAHSTNGLGKGVTVFKGSIRNERDLLEALRAGDFFPIEGFHVGRPIYYGRDSLWDPALTNALR
ncbi:MAG: PHP domain-containing protein [Chloroflexi bacterium]|nr:PHP domain-containing protein [Chloroflexota bacterium]